MPESSFYTYTCQVHCIYILTLFKLSAWTCIKALQHCSIFLPRHALRRFEMLVQMIRLFPTNDPMDIRDPVGNATYDFGATGFLLVVIQCVSFRTQRVALLSNLLSIDIELHHKRV